jgi:hypothetical protein
MLIIPFTHKTIQNNEIEINIITILTIGGDKLWEESNSLDIDKDILNPNDIWRTGPILKLEHGKVQLCQVDTQKTKMSDFYKWEETDIKDKDVFSWRSFYYFKGAGNLNWLDVPASEKLSGYSVKDFLQKIIQ